MQLLQLEHFDKGKVCQNILIDKHMDNIFEFNINYKS